MTLMKKRKKKQKIILTVSCLHVNIYNIIALFTTFLFFCFVIFFLSCVIVSLVSRVSTNTYTSFRINIRIYFFVAVATNELKMERPTESCKQLQGSILYILLFLFLYFHKPRKDEKIKKLCICYNCHLFMIKRSSKTNVVALPIWHPPLELYSRTIYTSLFCLLLLLLLFLLVLHIKKSNFCIKKHRNNSLISSSIKVNDTIMLLCRAYILYAFIQC